MPSYSPVKCVVEFMDGTERIYQPVGGWARSPRISGDGKLMPVTVDLIYQSGQYETIKHLATIPLINVRQYRLEPL